MLAHQNLLVEGFAVLLLVLFFDPFHVHFRATYHDAGQNLLPGSFTLRGDKESETTQNNSIPPYSLLPTIFLKSFVSTRTHAHTQIPSWLGRASQQRMQACFQHILLQGRIKWDQ